MQQLNSYNCNVFTEGSTAMCYIGEAKYNAKFSLPIFTKSLQDMINKIFGTLPCFLKNLNFLQVFMKEFEAPSVNLEWVEAWNVVFSVLHPCMSRQCFSFN